MQIKRFLAAALAAGALAQNGNGPSLIEALRSNNASLSGLAQVIGTLPSGVVDQLNRASNITILAPNNDAIRSFLNSSATTQAIAADPGLATAVIFYHVLNGTYYASNFTNSSAQFIPTLLSNETYTNVTGGQRVEVITTDEGDVAIYSALKENSTVVEANLNFTGGTIHVINRVLTVPGNITTTLHDANLTAALGAIQQADLAENLTDTKDITVFAPNNDAFARIASLGGQIDQQTLQQVLEYHVVEGQVLYSDMISNTTVQSLDNGTDLNITEIDGAIFVNNAQVVIRDLLISNGVLHVINNVLNPNNTSLAPNTTAATPVPAFNATTATNGGNPFTSGANPGGGVGGVGGTGTAATGTATTGTAATGTEATGTEATGTEATGTAATGTAATGTEGTGTAGGAGATSTSQQAAMPMRTAAVGVAALFGAGAVAFNL